MSYIRSTSNPESLYIWGGEKHVHVAHRVERPLSSEKEIPALFDVPTKAFESVCARWAKGREKVSCRGFAAERVHVFMKTGRIVPHDRSPMTQLKSKAEFLVRLSYKKNFVHLWLVTWETVTRCFER